MGQVGDAQVGRLCNPVGEAGKREVFAKNAENAKDEAMIRNNLCKLSDFCKKLKEITASGRFQFRAFRKSR